MNDLDIVQFERDELLDDPVEEEKKEDPKTDENAAAGLGALFG